MTLFPLDFLSASNYTSECKVKLYSVDGELLSSTSCSPISGTYMEFYPAGPLNLMTLYLASAIDASKRIESFMRQHAYEKCINDIMCEISTGKYDKYFSGKNR